MDSLIDNGKLEFTMHATAQPAEFLVCSVDAPKATVARAMAQNWELGAPGMLLRVTGAIEIDQIEAIDHVLEGVARGVSAARGIIFSTGLGFGVAASMGQVIGRERHHCQAPLSGVTSWVSVQGREQLLNGEVGSKRKYTDVEPDSDMSTVSLEFFHSHFVIVKADEVALAKTDGMSHAEKLLAARRRSFTFAHALEHELGKHMADRRADSTAIPRILMVINGDATTLSEVVAYTSAGHGVVLLAAATGGLARVLADVVVRNADAPIPEAWRAHEVSINTLRQLHAERSAESAAAGGGPPLFVATEHKSVRDVQDALLDATMVQAPTPACMVRYAIEWDDASRLHAQLAKVPAWAAERTPVLTNALQLALELQHARCVEVCIENAAPVGRIDLLRIYDALFDDANPPLVQLFKGRPTPTSRMLAWQRGEKETGLSVDLGDPVYQYYPVEVWELLDRVVPDLVLYWRKKTASVPRRQPDAEAGAPAPASAPTSAPAPLLRVPSRYVPLDEESAEEVLSNGKGPGPRWLDVYIWAILLGQHKLALALLPSCREPMRAAVIGARLCTEMANALPLHALSLAAAARDHEATAIRLLDLCESFEEARRMLVTKSSMWRKTLLELAVQSDLRPLCAHVQSQTLCDAYMMGNTDFDAPSIVLNGAPSSLRLFLHMLFPFDLPWLEPMLAWQMPMSSMAVVRKEMAIDDDVPLLAARAPMRPPPPCAFYQIPQVKLIVRFTAHMVYTFLVSYATVETPWIPNTINEKTVQEVHTTHAHLVTELVGAGHEGGGLESWRTDFVVWLWTIALICDEINKYISFPSTFQAEFWNRYDYFTFGLVQISLVFRFLSIRGSVESMCFAVILVWCRLFKYLQLDYNLGVLVIVLMRMTKDIAMWMLLSSIVLVAFTVSFVSIANPYVLEESGDKPEAAPIWAMLGSYDLEEVYDWNNSIGKPIMWIYLVVSNVVLVNLLIAMMGNTFSEVYADADREWKFGRLRNVIEVTERFSALPPPLNVGLTAYHIVGYLRCKMFDHPRYVEWYSFGEQKVSMGDAAKADERRKMKVAKKAKSQVALKLKFALKRQDEREAATSMDAMCENVLTGVHGQSILVSTVQQQAARLENIERLLDHMAATPARKRVGLLSGRGAAPSGAGEVQA